MPQLKDKDKLLTLVPEHGKSIGNISLMNLLDWNEAKYWKVRNQLIDDKPLERGRGMGGSVRRCSRLETDITSPRMSEVTLYEPLLKVLKAEWIQEMRIDPAHIHFEITANLGKKATGGTWTRPDITAVSVRSFQHLPNKYLDVWTFEVKSLDALDVTAIFEAAAHASRATRSYALLQMSKNVDAESDVVDRCVKEAARLGVGLIVFSSPDNFSTWETKVEALRKETAPEALNEFVGHLSEKAKEQLGKWK